MASDRLKREQTGTHIQPLSSRLDKPELERTIPYVEAGAFRSSMKPLNRIQKRGNSSKVRQSLIERSSEDADVGTGDQLIELFLKRYSSRRQAFGFFNEACMVTRAKALGEIESIKSLFASLGLPVASETLENALIYNAPKEYCEPSSSLISKSVPNPPAPSAKKKPNKTPNKLNYEAF